MVWWFFSFFVNSSLLSRESVSRQREHARTYAPCAKERERQHNPRGVTIKSERDG